MSTQIQRPSLPMLQQSASFSGRPSSRDSLFPSPPAHKWNIQGLRLRRQSQIDRNVTAAEAVWFLSLPDKIRRQQFSKEEQILIRAKSEIALLNASPELRNIADDAISIRSVRRKSVAYESPSRTSSIPSVPALPEKYRKSQDGQEDDASSLAKDSCASSPLFPAPRVPHDSVCSPDNIPGIHVQSSFLKSPTMDFSVWNRPTHSRTASTTRSMIKTSQRALPPPPIYVTKPLYLRDPGTKAMLRQANATPQRFEETLAFGFRREASGPLTPGVEVYSPGTEIKEHWLDVTKHDDEGIEADLSSADEVDMPLTPDFIVPRVVRPKSGYFSINSSISAAPSPHVNRAETNTSHFEDLMNRDMTLRMTLTKPELRASDEEIYGSQDSSSSRTPKEEIVDPLALGELSFSDDISGVNGAFAQPVNRKKSIKGFWFKK